MKSPLCTRKANVDSVVITVAYRPNHFVSALKSERLLLLFGLFTAPYGLALVCRSILLPKSDGWIELSIAIFTKLIGLVAGIPALLLFEEFYGCGARRVALNETEWISMSEEMRAARKIQASILPTKMPSSSGFDVAAQYSPMTAVAGDFYGFPQVQPGVMRIIVADVMGHGVPAALVASMVKVSVFAGAEKAEGPAGILGDLNATLCQEAPGQFATAVYVSPMREMGVGRYSAGGHPPPLLWRRQLQKLEALDTAGSDSRPVRSDAPERGAQLVSGCLRVMPIGRYNVCSR
jgi:Stage II sporulation protein E (SpoIIE)